MNDELRERAAQAAARAYGLGEEGIGDTLAACRDEIGRLRAAVAGIAPWLSASLGELPEGHDGAYVAACEVVFSCDVRG